MMSSPLLLVPGLNCTRELWAPQVAAFSPGRPVIVADHTRAETMAEIAAGILAEAPARFALAGLSMGGYVAMEILRRAPDRVERLALLDTQARADGDEARATRLQQIDIADRGGFDRIVDLQIPRLLSPEHQRDDRLVTVVRRMAADTGAPAFVRQQKAILGRIDSRPSLAAIRCPTVVIVGDEDVITPPELAREMSEAIPGAIVETIAASGHLSTIEAPDAVTAALARWLDA
jgi:pimeloyl-ACP methyl ester carboxylesterase